MKFRSLLIITNGSYLSLLIVEEGLAGNLPASPGLAYNSFTGAINVQRHGTITILVILDTRRNEKTVQATFEIKKVDCLFEDIVKNTFSYEIIVCAVGV